MLCNCFKWFNYLKSHVKIVTLHDETCLLTFDMNKL